MTAAAPKAGKAAPRAAGGGLSVVVACYNMKREIARTLRSLSGGYQRLIDPADYEVILVDNGSTEPPQLEDFADLDLSLRVLHYPAPTQSPMNALNYGLAACANDLIGVMVDGARMATPGLLAAAVNAAKLHPRAIVFTQSLHLGPGFQSESIREGYSREVEDRLLASIDWPENGYRLFEIGAWMQSGESEDRWAQLLFESNALFMPRPLWNEVGGYEPGFVTAGGGAGSSDLFHRACSLPGVQLIVITGEATFHQLHDESASSASLDWLNRFKEYTREQKRLRREPQRFVKNPYWTFGLAPPEAYVTQPDRIAARSPNPSPGMAGSETAGRYVELLKQALLNEINLDLEAHWLATVRLMEMAGTRPPSVSDFTRRQQLRRLIASRRVGMHSAQLPFAMTLIGRVRLENIEDCVRIVLDEGIPGDLVECGVWRGGACIFMAGLLAARGVTERKVWVADSFEGFPEATDPVDKELSEALRAEPGLVVSAEQVRANFERFGLWSDQVRLVKGWFKDLPAAPIGQIAVLRLDGDLYASTMDALEALYDKVSPGGFVIIDDFHLIEACAKAVHDFRRARGIEDPMRKIDWSASFWRKSGA